MQSPDGLSEFFGFSQNEGGSSDAGASFTVRLKHDGPVVRDLLQIEDQLNSIEMLNIATFIMETQEPDGSYQLYTEIPKPLVIPPTGTPTHVDSPAFTVGLYDDDPDRKYYFDADEIDQKAFIYDHAVTSTGPLTSSVSSAKSFTQPIGNSLTEIAKSNFTLTVLQSLSTNASVLPDSLREAIAMNEGYFYDLLPKGWRYDKEAPCFVRSNTGGSIDSASGWAQPAGFVDEEPQLIDDFRGTGRQLVIFHVKYLDDAEGRYNYRGANSGFVLQFGGYITYGDVGTNYTFKQDGYGNVTVQIDDRNYNIAVYQGVEKDEDGNPTSQEWELMHQPATTTYYDDGDFGSAVYRVTATEGPYAGKNVFFDINEDGVTNKNDTLFMNAYGVPNFVQSVETGVNKLIMGKSGKWQMSDVTDVSDPEDPSVGNYKYRVDFTSTGSGTTYGVVIYDILEDAANTDPRSPEYPHEHYWRGTFRGMDEASLQALRDQGIAVKVFYSTEEPAQGEGKLNYNALLDQVVSQQRDEHPELNLPMRYEVDEKPERWSLTPPADLSKVTAVAVDLRLSTETDPETGEALPYIFAGDNGTASFTLNMRAPESVPEDIDAVYAYNRLSYTAVMNANGVEAPRNNVNDRVKIELEDLQTVRFRKLTSADDDPDQEIPLGGVLFYLYKTKCGYEQGGATGISGQTHTHIAPPTAISTTGASTNDCWERVAVVQTTSQGYATFPDLSEGTYAVREYNPYDDANTANNTYVYELTPTQRMQNMWWIFKVDTRRGLITDLEGTPPAEDGTPSGPVYMGSASGAYSKDSKLLYLAQETGNTFRVKNTRRRIEIRIQKYWHDGGAGDADRPDSIQVNLLRDGEVFKGPLTLSKDNGWVLPAITDLPYSNQYGNHVYKYTVEEINAPLEGYDGVGYSNTSSLSVINGVYYYTRQIHNVKTAQLAIMKTVEEGGDREKAYQFQLTLYDYVNTSNPMANATVSATLYHHYGEADETSEKITCKTDNGGQWGRMYLKHGDLIVLHDLPVGTRYEMKEIGADGYTQTYTDGKNASSSSSGTIVIDKTENDVLTNRRNVKNSYTAYGTGEIEARKTINGQRPVFYTQGRFRFQLDEIQRDEALSGVEVHRMNGTSAYSITFPYQGSSSPGTDASPNNMWNDNVGVIHIPTLRWTTHVSGCEGDIWYSLRELIQPPYGASTLDGYTLDDTEYRIKVHIKDQGTGFLEPVLTFYRVDGEGVDGQPVLTELDSGQDVVINNTYEADGVLQLKFKKTINGMEAGDWHFKNRNFTYTLTRSDGETYTAASDKTGYAVLGDVEFDHNDNTKFFRYTLKEDVCDDEGMTVDSIVYQITAQIRDEGGGRISATFDIVGKNNQMLTPSGGLKIILPRKENPNAAEVENMLSKLVQYFSFSNTYEAQGYWEVPVQKQINGVKIDTSLYKNNTYTFTISSLDGEGNETLLDTQTNGADGVAKFRMTGFTEADINSTFTYILHETGTDGDGVTVSDVPWTITIRVDDAGDGQLSPVITKMLHGEEEVYAEGDGKEEEVVFDNPYEAYGTGEIEARKTVNGQQPGFYAQGRFRFQLDEIRRDKALSGVEVKRMDGTNAQSITFPYQGATEPGSDSTPGDMWNDGAGVIHIPTLRWTTHAAGCEGDIWYSLRELIQPPYGASTLDGYTLDDTEYRIKVHIKDQGTGFLEPVLTFYRVDGEGVDGQPVLTELDSGQDVVINNTYEADGVLQLKFKKTINGMEAGDWHFKNRNFTYTLTRSDGETYTAASDKTGYAVLGDVEFDHNDNTKFFRYTLKEDVCDDEGMTVDSIVYQITAQIRDEGGGRISATFDIVGKNNQMLTPSGGLKIILPRKENPNAAEVENMLSKLVQYFSFSNTYEAQGYWEVPVQKQINGVKIDTSLYKNNTYTFTISSLDGEGNETLLDTQTNGADGVAKFRMTGFTEADINSTFTYILHETGTDGDGVTVSDVPWTITIRVDDAGDGQLSPVITKMLHGEEEVYAEGDGKEEEVVFDNPYEAYGCLELPVIKRLNGEEVPEGVTFRFALDDEVVFRDPEPETPAETEEPEQPESPDPKAQDDDGQEEDSAVPFKKDREGNRYTDAELVVTNEGSAITFPALWYDLSDVGKTYTYYLYEKIGDERLYVFDGTYYEVKVTIADQYDGTLDMKHTITAHVTQEDGSETAQPAEEIIFNNENLTQLTIEKKVYSSREITKEFLFTVRLTTPEGEPLPGEYAYDGSRQGTVADGLGEIALKDGESVTIHDLPMGTCFDVTEADDIAFETGTAIVTDGEGNMLARGGATVTFSNTEIVTSITVTKVWQGGQGGIIDVTLGTVQEGKFIPLSPQPAVERDDDVYTYSDLPKYNDNGEEIVYAVQEKTYPGYGLKTYVNLAPNQSVSGYVLDGGVIRNTRTTDFQVRKEWVGLNKGETPPEITLVLYENGKPTNKKPTLDKKGWYHWYNLDATKTYYAVEVPMEGFNTIYQNKGSHASEDRCAFDMGTIINSRIPKTGDTEPLELLYAAAGCSFTALVLLILLKKREKRKNTR